MLYNRFFFWSQENRVLSNVASLPVQSDNSGKILTTDGTDANWTDDITLNNITTTKLHIYENNGTVASNNDGSIVLEHNNTGGRSSIVFKSNDADDFAAVEYDSQMGSSGDKGVLRLIICNDNDDTSGAEDEIRFKIGSTSNDNFVFTSNGLSINKSADPAEALDVEGNITATGNLTVAGTLDVNGATTIDGQLHIQSTADASLTAGTGALVIGDTAGAHTSIDSNEIMARNGSSTSTLHVQNNGGRINIGGSAVGSGLNTNQGFQVFVENAETTGGSRRAKGSMKINVLATSNGAAGPGYVTIGRKWGACHIENDGYATTFQHGEDSNNNRYWFYNTSVQFSKTNTVTLGVSNYRWSTIYSVNSLNTSSDIRDKKDVYDIDLGLEFINKLRPVTYKWDLRNSTRITDRIHMGLIAQEIKTALGDNASNLGLWCHDPAEEPSEENPEGSIDSQSLRYEELIAPMVKAIQELSAENKTLQARLTALEQQINQ